jgi:hypothetical protein
MFKSYYLKTQRDHFALKFIYFLALCLFLYKSRIFFLEPRIWAEEGTVYLKDAVLHGFRSLWSTHQGYYSVIPNVTVYVSTLFNYKYIPYFTLFVSLGFWGLLFFLIKKMADPVYKILLFISLFVILNQYQQLFLNTINLQFITPLLLLVFLQHDLNNMSAKKHLLLLFVIFFALLNGVLGIIMLPYLVYKLIVSKLYKTLIFCFFCIAIYAFIYLSFKSSGGDLSLGNRIMCNFNLKYEYWKINQVSFIKMHYYIILPFLSLLFLIKKKWEIALILMTVFVNFCFIDITKLCNLQITERYRAYLYASSLIFFYYLAQKYLTEKLLYLPTLIIIIFCSRAFFQTEHSYCRECAQWSTEYQNLLNKENTKIHPKGWEINLKE